MNVVAKEVTYIIHHAEVNTSYIQIKFLPPPHLPTTTLHKYKYYFSTFAEPYECLKRQTACLLLNQTLHHV